MSSSGENLSGESGDLCVAHLIGSESLVTVPWQGGVMVNRETSIRFHETAGILEVASNTERPGGAYHREDRSVQRARFPPHDGGYPLSSHSGSKFPGTSFGVPNRFRARYYRPITRRKRLSNTLRLNQTLPMLDELHAVSQTHGANTLAAGLPIASNEKSDAIPFVRIPR